MQTLVIFGGRNDNIYAMTNNVALNDICIFNLNTYTWETLAMYGQMPCSRWGHCMTAKGYDNSASEGMLVFGGVNLASYCKSKVYTFQFHDLKTNKILSKTTTEKD